MKILLINTLYTPYHVGGAEVSVQILAESLARQGHSLRVLTLHEKKIRIAHQVNGVSVVCLPLKNLYWPFDQRARPSWKRLIFHLFDTFNPVMARRVGREIDRFAPDVVHTNCLVGFSVSVWREAKRRGIPLVHTTRDYYLFHPTSTLFKNGRNMGADCLEVQAWSWVKRKLSPQVDCAVGISQFISELHKESKFFLNAERTYVYNPIETIELTDVNRNRRPVIGFIGRLGVDKGFDTFCEIAANYRQNEARFVAAGNFKAGKEADILRRKAEEGNVELLGFVRFGAFINEVDAIVLPTRWREPFGRTVVESALAGRQVYTNMVGGIAELAVRFKNIYDLDECNVDADLVDLIERRKRYDLPIIVNDFDEASCSKNYAEIYKDLCPRVIID